MSRDDPKSLSQLLDSHAIIEIPIIQRDYAQGGTAVSEVREAFLDSLSDALNKPTKDRYAPLNLDFIYGSTHTYEVTDGREQGVFAPLDGQQRLTTLFLLHWYLAWRDSAWEAFAAAFLQGDKARFTYSVRPSSTEFFNALAAYRPIEPPERVQELSSLITDQPWYFRNWRLDPTVQACLEMLDALHKRFAASSGLYERLVDAEKPAITFHLLRLENFGLSDDLYIKMNARGKPLTAFETFKAQLDKFLSQASKRQASLRMPGSLPLREYVSLQFDTKWADLFWELRDRDSNLYDDAVMNLLRLIALATRDPGDGGSYDEDLRLLRTTATRPTYTEFHQRNWLDDRFISTVIALFDTWSADDGRLTPLLPDNQHFDEARFVNDASTTNAPMAYSRLVQFLAYSQFVTLHSAALDPQEFQAWMRIVTNLAINKEYNRPSDFRSSALGVFDLLPNARSVLCHIASPEATLSGFNEIQQEEERLKAQLMLAHTDWSPLIERAEQHVYFRGQIGFLLDFAGVLGKSKSIPPSEWASDEHLQAQQAFKRYLAVAKLMFADNGLNELEGFLWQRALLSIGDYLLPSGRNRSFLVDASSEQGSWKRLLRDGHLEGNPRGLLKRLWDQLDTQSDLASQLEGIIKGSEVEEPWRRCLVNQPAALEYCEKRALRWHWDGTIYLLKRSQLNGAHAELFSYSLHHELATNAQAVKSLSVGDYVSVNDLFSEPHFTLEGYKSGESLRIKVSHERGLYTLLARVSPHPQAVAISLDLKKLGYEHGENTWFISCSEEEVRDHISALEALLSN